MLKRLVTGIILAVGVTLAVIYFPILPIKIAVILLVGLAAYECARMVIPPGSTRAFLLAALMSMALSFLILFGPRDFNLVAWGLPGLVMITLIAALLRPQPISDAVQKITGTLFTVLYVGLLLSFLGLIREFFHGWQWLLVVLAVTFAADTGAFFAGRWWGRLKLAPAVSPGKTFEGLLGGLGLAAAAAFFLRAVFFREMTVADGFWVAGLAGILGPLGDLAESLLKRSVGVKDSSHLLPGHGGILDRLDALLFTAPLIYWYVAFIR